MEAADFLSVVERENWRDLSLVGSSAAEGSIVSLFNEEYGGGYDIYN